MLDRNWFSIDRLTGNWWRKLRCRKNHSEPGDKNSITLQRIILNGNSSRKLFQDAFFYLRIFWGWKNKNPKIWILWSPKPPWEVGDYDVWKLRQEMPSSRAPSREAAKPTVQAVQAPVPVRLNPLRAVLKVTFWADVNMVKGWKWWMKLVKRSSCCTWSSYYILYKYLQHIQDIIQDITSVATYQWFDSIYLHVGY